MFYQAPPKKNNLGDPNLVDCLVVNLNLRSSKQALNLSSIIADASPPLIVPTSKLPVDRKPVYSPRCTLYYQNGSPPVPVSFLTMSPPNLPWAKKKVVVE